MRWLLPALLVLVTLARYGAAALLPVSPDEAYFWMQAGRLDWAYFEMPAGTAALIRVGGDLLGPGPLGLRLFAPAFAALATVAIFAIGRRTFGPRVGLVAAVALNLLPAFHAAACHAGPAMPTLALLLAAALAFLRALDSGRPTDWLAAGLASAGAAFFSYAALLAPLAALLVVVTSPRQRRHLRHAGPWTALVLALAANVPALAWNTGKSWPLLALGTWRSELTPDFAAIGPALATAIAGASLPLFLAWLLGLGLGIAAARIHAKPRIFLRGAAPFLLLWLHGLLQGRPGLTLLTLAIALTLPLAVQALSTHRTPRIAGALALAAAMVGLLVSPPDPRAGTIPWADVATGLRGVLATLPASPRPTFVIAPSPEATAALNYHLAGTGSEVYLRESQDLSNQFGLWPRYDDFVKTDRPADEFFQLEGSAQNPNVGRNALYLGEEDLADLPQTITAAFARVTSLSSIPLPGGRKLRVYLCENYQTMPL